MMNITLVDSRTKVFIFIMWLLTLKTDSKWYLNVEFSQFFKQSKKNLQDVFGKIHKISDLNICDYNSEALSVESKSRQKWFNITRTKNNYKFI